MKVDLIGEPQPEEFDPILIPGNLDPQVATNKFWLAYLRSMEEEIRNTSAQVINATEGGAQVEGADTMPLSRVISSCCTRDAMVSSTLQMSVGFFFGFHTDEGKMVFREGLAILNHALEQAQAGQNRVQALSTIANSPEPDPGLMGETMDEVLAIHKNLVQDQKVYVVLDEAADQVLSSFLRRENRPSSDEPTLENVQKTISRYQPYFSGMERLCSQYITILEETLTTLDYSSPFEV